MKSTIRSKEVLTHFRCIFCNKWWTIGEVPITKTKWFCPWCGKLQEKINTQNKSK
ncbi:hypothetical protein HY045_00970 [Candidatus Woesebacteria bacterium]|nr:hypothetical protein [Candidatus Woesebacteria bacterium]